MGGTGTYGLHVEGHVSHDGESGIKFIVQAHEPHRVERIDDSKTPAIEAAYDAVSINGSGCGARQRTDALIDVTLGERK